ncbi:UPF0489 family protein [Ralstonia pseudosolanacearum]|uniref:UPF0489 family protein n=1 Tax=Ralstonia pseudosolanacearum TaxID=1310165 RepID=UPI0039C5E6B2
MAKPHEKINIGGKDVYIVRSHHHVLQSWAEIRRSLSAAPALLTLDHHTDTYEPFLRHRYHATHRTPGDDKRDAMDALLPVMIAELRYDDEASVLEAIYKLYNDEHVRTAIMGGIMSHGFVVNLSNENHSEHGIIYLTSSICAIGCKKMPHDDDCTPVHSGQVLESVYLDHELGELNTMAQKDGVPAVETKPYVLDIDLDYFHSEKAIEPDDPATFYRLVRNAVAVTIATEPDYVKSCRDEGSKVTGKSLLARMKRHIEAAMT